MKYKTLLSAVLLSIGGLASAQHSCQASAEPYAENIDAIGNYTVSFTVTPVNCPGKCRGYVNFDLVYQGRTGRVHKIRGQRLWKSESNDAAEVTRTGMEAYCSPLSLGPCEVRDVKLYNITCRTEEE